MSARNRDAHAVKIWHMQVHNAAHGQGGEFGMRLGFLAICEPGNNSYAYAGTRSERVEEAMQFLSTHYTQAQIRQGLKKGTHDASEPWEIEMQRAIVGFGISLEPGQTEEGATPREVATKMYLADPTCERVTGEFLGRQQLEVGELTS
jgi:hypothetical protein